MFFSVKKSKVQPRGFTIVELLIVIVVIAILAAISIVAYNGIQERARNTKRVNDVVAIQKALELFRTEKGRYPSAYGANSPGSADNLPAGFSPPYSLSGYTYSIATNDSWLKELRDSGLAQGVPIAPGNNTDSNYVYFSSTGLGSCTEPFYMLMVVGWEGGVTTMPTSPRSQTLTCSIAGVVTAGGIERVHGLSSRILTIQLAAKYEYYSVTSYSISLFSSARSRLDAAICVIAMRVRILALPTCGKMMQFFRLKRGLSTGSGSGVVTSRPAA